MNRRRCLSLGTILVLLSIVVAAYAATITLNARYSGQWIYLSGVTLAHCYYSGTVHMTDPNHRAKVVRFYLSGVYGGGIQAYHVSGNDWGYGDYSNSTRAVGSGPYQTQDVAEGEVISTGQSVGDVASGYADWYP